MTQRICPTCKGSGRCPSCEGRGSFEGPDHMRASSPAPSLPCGTCFGGGRCRECSGSGSLGEAALNGGDQ